MGMMILERLQAIGAFAVRSGRFDLVRSIALRSTRSTRRASPLWLDDMQRRAAKADLYRDGVHQGGATRRVWPLSRAHDAVEHNPRLAPDLLPDDEYVMTSLCEFAFLADLAAIDHMETARFTTANFAGWFSERTDPIVVDLLDPESDVRKAIFPYDDAELAAALVAIRDRAAQRGSPLGLPWNGYEDPRVVEFIDKYA